MSSIYDRAEYPDPLTLSKRLLYDRGEPLILKVIVGVDEYHT